MSNTCNPKSFSQSVLLTVACITLAGCEQDAAVQQEAPARPVKLLTIGTSAAGGKAEFPGSVSPAQESEMAFQVSGQIIEIPVAEGEFVEKGTIVAKMDGRDYAAGRDKAAAQRNAAKADYDRFAKAFESGAVTAQDLDSKKRNYEVTQADLRTAQKAIDDTNLKAPFAGRIAKKLVEDFATVQAKEPVLILQDVSSLQMKINIPEQAWAQAEPGLSKEAITERLKPQVELAAIPGRQFPASIRENSSTADPVTGTYEVTLDFERPADLNISPGMSGKIVVTTPSRSVAAGTGSGTLIPASAVVADAENNPYVWVVAPESNAVTRRPVQVGPLSGDSIRVTSGLENGDRVAISGVHTLVEGTTVRAMSE